MADERYSGYQIVVPDALSDAAQSFLELAQAQQQTADVIEPYDPGTAYVLRQKALDITAKAYKGIGGSIITGYADGSAGAQVRGTVHGSQTGMEIQSANLPGDPTPARGIASTGIPPNPSDWAHVERDLPRSAGQIKADTYAYSHPAGFVSEIIHDIFTGEVWGETAERLREERNTLLAQHANEHANRDRFEPTSQLVDGYHPNLTAQEAYDLAMGSLSEADQQIGAGMTAYEQAKQEAYQYALGYHTEDGKGPAVSSDGTANFETAEQYATENWDSFRK